MSTYIVTGCNAIKRNGNKCRQREIDPTNGFCKYHQPKPINRVKQMCDKAVQVNLYVTDEETILDDD